MDEATTKALMEMYRNPYVIIKDLQDTMRELLGVMEMQEKRESEEFHIPQDVALLLWNKAKERAYTVLLIKKY